MKNMNILLLLIIIFLGISCSEENNNLVGYQYDTSIYIEVVDQQGSDLLDTSNTNHFNIDNIKIFHMIDGELTECFNGLSDVPKGFEIINPNHYSFNEQCLFWLQATDISYHTNKLETLQPITYIQWSEMDMDTIQCQYSQTESSLITTKVWFNGNVVWNIDEKENNDPRLFQIVK